MAGRPEALRAESRRDAWESRQEFQVRTLPDDCTHLPSPLGSRYDWTGKVCTGSTPYFMPLNLKTMGICVSSCPDTLSYTTINCIGGVTGSLANVENGYCLFQYATTEVLNRCVVDNATALAEYGLR